MGLLDAFAERTVAILTSAYPVGAPYIPAGTFTVGEVFLPAQNPKFPTGAVVDRRFDFVWKSMGFDINGSEVGVQGPWVRDPRLEIRVQYKIAQPPGLAPPKTELVLGALEAATRKALNDVALIQWAMTRPGAYADLAIGVLFEEDATADKADALRAIGTTRVTVLKSQSVVSSPGV